MYWVVNTTKPPQSVSIGDLNLIIGAKKAIDLEKVCDRHKIEESKDLKQAIKSKMLQVRHSAKTNKKKDHIVEPVNSLNDKELAKIRSTVRDEIQSLMGGQSSPDLLKAVNNLLEVTQSLKDSPPQKVVVEHATSSLGSIESQEIDEVEDIDEEKLAEIHARAIKNKTQNAETKLTYNERKGDNSVADRASELDDLLA